MLSLVLILVLGALGLLVVALLATQSLWAWASIGLSVVAGILLLTDFVRGRARRSGARQAPRAGPGRADGKRESGKHARPAGDGEPGEEDSTPADVAVVSRLDTEVVVVDAQPRYHLTGCAWLDEQHGERGRERRTVGLPVKEARDLGFTPCAVCAPDAHLAAAHRTSA